MKVALNLPVLLSAKPLGSRTVRDVHLTSRREFEIPEYSLKDCVLAYSVPATLFESRFQLLSLGGRLFRRIGPLGEALDDCFTHPFSGTVNQAYASLGINVQFEGRLRLQQQLGLRGRKTWPPPSPDRAGDNHDSRNRTFLEDVIGSFEDINVAEYGEALLTTARVASGLAVIDGDLWCETPQPCIAVSVSEWFPGTYKVFKYTDFAQEIPCFHYGVSCRRFAVDDFEGADRYARELSEMPGRKSEIEHQVLKVTPHLAADDLNDDYEHMRRIARDLAHVCVTTAYKKPELVEDIDGEERNILERCKAALLAENYLLGERFDVTDVSSELLEVWRKLERPKPGQVLQLTPSRLVDEYLEKTLTDAATISVMPRSRPLTP